MKIPGGDCGAERTPVAMKDVNEATRALHETLTTLLGKRNSSSTANVAEEDMGTRATKRTRSGGKSKVRYGSADLINYNLIDGRVSPRDDKDQRRYHLLVFKNLLAHLMHTRSLTS